jgi:hypothetical protein
MKRTAAEEYAWVGPVVQGVCGVIAGGLVGIWLWAQCFDSAWGWIAIPATAVVFGTLAAVFGDRFWRHWFWDGA